MKEKPEGFILPQENLEDLRYQLKKAEQRHTELLKASQNDPKDAELRVEVDKAYSNWSRIRTEIEQIMGKEE